LEGRVKMEEKGKTKGSKLWMQKIANELKDKFEIIIKKDHPELKNLKFIWISPQAPDLKKEYRNGFIKVKALNYCGDKKIKDFWPSTGPSWDGVIVTESENGKKGLILIEAKANLDEMKPSKTKSISNENSELIHNSIKYVSKKFNIKLNNKISYQLLNRLTFLAKLNEYFEIETKLIYLHFINDTSYKPTKKEQFVNYYKSLSENGLDMFKIENAIIAYIDIEEEFHC